MDINSIIEIISSIKKQQPSPMFGYNYSDGWQDACDELIGRIKHIEQFQPIDSAPKDGTHFLGYREGEESYSEAWWRPDVQSFGGKGWRYPDNSGPTHWMPLPPKPTGGVK